MFRTLLTSFAENLEKPCRASITCFWNNYKHLWSYLLPKQNFKYLEKYGKQLWLIYDRLELQLHSYRYIRGVGCESHDRAALSRRNMPRQKYIFPFPIHKEV